MSILNLLGISDALASTTAQHPSASGSFLSMLPFLILFILVFYFLLIRPQSKRAKEHKSLLDNLAVGDEIITTGGIVGTLAKLRDNYIVLAIAEGVEITMKKSSITSVLPKGTIDSI